MNWAFALFALALALTAHSAHAFSLSDYAVVGRFALPAGAAEASAVTSRWDTRTLFVLGDGGKALVEVSPDGAHVSEMT